MPPRDDRQDARREASASPATSTTIRHGLSGWRFQNVIAYDVAAEKVAAVCPEGKLRAASEFARSLDVASFE
ncbi:MAG: hypothetical protein WDN08_04700 [Rhizomicrobium sp.]